MLRTTRSGAGCSVSRRASFSLWISSAVGSRPSRLFRSFLTPIRPRACEPRAERQRAQRALVHKSTTQVSDCASSSDCASNSSDCDGNKG
eukprot:2964606-Prymnesium_polylepis.1